MLEDIKEWHKEVVVSRLIKSLKNNGFNAHYAKTKEEAIRKVLKFISKDTKVGIGDR